MSCYVDIEVKNYRCFEDSSPLRFQIRKGSVAFTGPNNSGKSTILRFIYELRNLWVILSGLPDAAQHHGNTVLQALDGREINISFHNVKDQEDVFCNFNNRPIIITLFFDGLKTKYLYAQKIEVEINRHLKSTIKISNDRKELINNKQESIKLHNLKDLDLEETHEMISALSSTLYIGAFRNAINAGGGQYFDLVTGAEFIKLWKEWQSGNSKAHRQAIINVLEDIKALFDFDDLSVVPSSDASNLVVTANGKTLMADELGAGLTQFIIILGNLVIYKPNLVLMDEPELNLHPVLQIKFLSIVESYVSFGVLFSTHSIGLARSGADLIYSVLKEGSKSIIKPWGTNSGYLELAGELSYSTYPDLGAGKVLLCEGTTEVKALQHFLRLLDKDKDVLIIPLGGSSLINGNTASELGELKRLKVSISVVIDSEKSSLTEELSQQRKDFVVNCEKLGFNVHVLTRRAFENYLTDKAIKSLKGDNYRALSAYELLDNISPKWAKSENWKIALKMNMDDILGNDLGEFLQKL